LAFASGWIDGAPGAPLENCRCGARRGRRQVVFERAPFHMSGHVPSLLRDFDQLLLDKWIAGLFGPLFALKGLGAVLLWLACPHATPPCVR